MATMQTKSLPDKLPAWLTAVRGAGFERLRTWPFWREMIVFFCLFSVAGHLVEYPYCWAGMTFFGSVEPDAEVLANPFKPFFVYGVGIVLCCIFLEPLRDWLLRRTRNPLSALGAFFVIGVFLGMSFELAQGFLQNQPVDGVYPLWDVHDYPGNILGQAWIVNDVFLGAIITAVVWVVLPPCHWLARRMDGRVGDMACLVIVAATLALTLATY